MIQARREAPEFIGPHVVTVHATEAGRRSTIAHWARDGVARGELVILPTVSAEYEYLLREALEPVALSGLPGSVRFSSMEDFLSPHGGSAVLGAAATEGHCGIRVAAPTDVAIARCTPEAYLAREAQLEKLTREQPLSVLCTYVEAAPPADDTLSVALAPHPVVTDGVLSTRTCTGDGGQVSVVLAGDVGAGSAVLLERVVARAGRYVDRAPMRVDAAGLRLFSASAARALLAGTTELREGGGEVSLERMSPVVERVATLLGLHQQPGLWLGSVR